MRCSPRGEVREEEHRGEGGGGEERVGEGGERPLLTLDHHPHRRIQFVSSGSVAGSQKLEERGGTGRRGSGVAVADEIDGEGKRRKWESGDKKLGCWAKAEGRIWAGPIIRTSTFPKILN